MNVEPGARFGPARSRRGNRRRRDGRGLPGRDTRLDRTVAIKVLSPDIADDPDSARPLRARGTRRRRPSTIPTSAASTTSASWRHALLRHAASRRPDAGRATGEGPLPLDQALKIAVRSPTRSTRRTAGDRPPRPEARQHHADQGGRQAPGLRPREAQGAGRTDLDVGDDADWPTRPQARRTARFSARCNTWRPSRSKAKRPTRAATSGRSAPCSTRWSPARDRSAATRRPRDRGDPEGRSAAARRLASRGAADAGPPGRALPAEGGRRPVAVGRGSLQALSGSARPRRLRREGSRASGLRRSRLPLAVSAVMRCSAAAADALDGGLIARGAARSAAALGAAASGHDVFEPCRRRSSRHKSPCRPTAG